MECAKVNELNPLDYLNKRDSWKTNIQLTSNMYLHLYLLPLQKYTAYMFWSASISTWYPSPGMDMGYLLVIAV